MNETFKRYTLDEISLILDFLSDYEEVNNEAQLHEIQNDMRELFFNRAKEELK